MSERLCDETRGPLLDPLFKTGWSMVAMPLKKSINSTVLSMRSAG